MSDLIQHLIDAPMEQSIIVRAGPGAGKTYLIAQRIASLLKRGIRKNAHIACITYTNTGVEEVEEELIPKHFVSKPHNLYLGTIHSFLIEYVLKPYGHFLDELPGTFQLTPPNGYVDRFLPFPENKNLPSYKRISYESIGYDQNGNYVCFRPVNMWTPSVTSMQRFKTKMHTQGFIDYFDILYFSWLILRKYPLIRESLSCRFASILVDEFQDTTVIQNEVLKFLFSGGKTSLFLVGDPDQSIFAFTGASPDTFRDYFNNQQFYCDSCGGIEHPIITNRRSSQVIIDFLNKRSTIKSGQNVSSQGWANNMEPVRVLTGGINNNKVNSTEFHQQAVRYFFALLNQKQINQNETESFGILAHENKLVALLNACSSEQIVNNQHDGLEKLKTISRSLHRLVERLLLAVKHRQVGEWAAGYSATDEALTFLLYEVTPNFCNYDEPSIGLNRELWRPVIWTIFNQIPEEETMTILDWCKQLKTLINNAVVQVGGNQIRSKLSLLDVRAQRAKPVANAITVGVALTTVFRPNLLQENFRTIHKAKGTQRDAILVMADNNEEFDKWLFHPDISTEEVSRKGFVAFSRAKKILCIGCPTITEEQRKKLLEMNIEVEVIGNNSYQPSLI